MKHFSVAKASPLLGYFSQNLIFIILCFFALPNRHAFQSTGCVLHVVPQPAQVGPLHRLAQLQVANHQGPHHNWVGPPAVAVLLRHPGLLREKDAGRVIFCFVFAVWK